MRENIKHRLKGKRAVSLLGHVFWVFAILMICFTFTDGFAATIEIEAEENFENQGRQAFQLIQDEEASGGACIQSTTTAKNWKSEYNASHFDEDEIVIQFTVPEDNRYTVYYRTRALPPYYNSFVYQIDNSMYIMWTNMTDKWEWTKQSTIKLKAGEHTLKIFTRSEKMKIDKFILTSDVLYTPEGKGEPPENEHAVYKDGEGAVFYALPAIVPPKGEHPRVMVRSSELDQVKANLEHPQNKSVYEQVLKYSQQDTLQSVPKGKNLDYMNKLESKAFMYLMTGDKAIGREAVESALQYYKNIYLGSTESLQLSRDAGELMTVAAFVYDWCYDCFEEGEREEYIEAIMDMSVVMEHAMPTVVKSGAMQIADHASESNILKDWLSFAIAVYDERPDFYNSVMGYIQEQFVEARNYWIPSEYNHQGSTYSGYRGAFDQWAAFLLSKIGGEGIFDNRMGKVPYMYFYMLRPDGNLVKDGDHVNPSFAPKTYTSLDKSQFFLAANLYKQGRLKRMYYKLMAPIGSYAQQQQSSISPAVYLLANDVNVEPEDWIDLPKTKFFGAPSGVMAARTSWEEGSDSNTAIAFMKMSERFFGAHTHYDAGSFQFYYRGMLAIDSGAYISYNTPHYLNYSSATVSHNCMLVDDPNEYIKELNNDGGQRLLPKQQYSPVTLQELQSDTYRTSKIIGYDYGPDLNTPEYSYFEGDISYAYTDKVKNYTRSFMFLNLFDDETPAALIVYDRIKTKQASFKKSWLLHSIEEPVIEGNTITIRRSGADSFGGGRLINTTLLPEKKEYEKIGGEGKEFFANGQNWPCAGLDAKGNEAGAWRVEISPSGEKQQDYFLNVMQVSDDDASIVPLDVQYEEIGDYIGIYVKDRAVFMKKDEGTAYKNVTIKAEAEEDTESSYITTNLREGLWTAYDADGAEVTKQAVVGENGVMYFRAPAGSYVLKWSYTENIPNVDREELRNTRPAAYIPVSILVGSYYDGRAILKNETPMAVAEDICKRLRPETSVVETKGDKVTVKMKERYIIYTVGSNKAVLNGAEITLPEAPLRYNELIYVPLEYMKDVLDLDYSFDSLGCVASLALKKYVVEGANPKINNYPDDNIAKIVDVTASDRMDESRDEFKSVDGSKGTFWCSTEIGATITWELKENYSINKISTAWYRGNERVQSYALYTSTDGKNWTQVFDGKNSGKTADFEDVVLDKAVNAKYVRLEAKGTTMNTTNSLYEVKIFVGK